MRERKKERCVFQFAKGKEKKNSGFSFFWSSWALISTLLLFLLTLWKCQKGGHANVATVRTMLPLLPNYPTRTALFFLYSKFNWIPFVLWRLQCTLGNIVFACLATGLQFHFLRASNGCFEGWSLLITVFRGQNRKEKKSKFKR